uniref:Uncharacterized protein LOC104225165 n=1 Tax=Nicotiana sylvestris TaxID=4096 RepID=A0A1U7WKN2_NICSY|nr:PREDICTED: uncharacterized protein LOC104225165 [Nicotiana sylvestris]
MKQSFANVRSVMWTRRRISRWSAAKLRERERFSRSRKRIPKAENSSSKTRENDPSRCRSSRVRVPSILKAHRRLQVLKVNYPLINTIFILLVLSFSNPIKAELRSKTYLVSIINNFKNSPIPLKIHCQSKNDDLGCHNLTSNQHFDFEFD